MKKFFYSIVALSLISTLSFAQVRVGVKGSLQFANQKISSQGFNITGSNLLGFQAGLLLDAPLSDNLSLRPQILYSVKGSKYDLSSLLGGLGGSGDATTTINYVEVPVQVAYGFEVGNGRVVLGAGPYIAYALNGKSKGNFNGMSGTESIEFGSGQNQTKRLDFGLHVSAGYELSSGLMLSGYYSPGLSSLSNAPSSDGTVKNTAFGVSLGFLFGGE